MKFFIASINSICLCFIFAASTLADAKVDPEPTKINSATAQPIPKRILAAIVGTVVGTPICAIRRTIRAERDGISGIVGDTDNKIANTSAGAFWLPFAVTVGVLESPCYSFKHSMCNTDKPFSKEQFSLANEAD